MTARQFGAWRAWLHAQMNQPDKKDSYLMQIAAEVRRVPYAFAGRNPNEVELDHLRLKWQDAREASQQFENNVEAAAQASKMRLMAAAGGRVTRVTISKEEAQRRLAEN